MKNSIICIGREYGSGGREIGELLSKKLGIPCYDKLLVQKAAQESGMSEAFLRRQEETPAEPEAPNQPETPDEPKDGSENGPHF